jgi:hypothetical protein
MSKAIGFTGSRTTPTDGQLTWLRTELITLKHVGYTEFHHGDCIGSDEAAHQIAHDVGLRTIVHPPINPKWRAWCSGDVILPEKDFVPRNHDIVDSCMTLLALPAGPEKLRSGTWATIRYALNRVPILLRLPDNPATICYVRNRVPKEIGVTSFGKQEDH